MSTKGPSLYPGIALILLYLWQGQPCCADENYLKYEGFDTVGCNRVMSLYIRVDFPAVPAGKQSCEIGSLTGNVL